MSLECTHDCDECKSSNDNAEICLCDKHFEEKLNAAYENGFSEGRTQGLSETKQ